MTQFYGEFEELKVAVERWGLKGDWRANEVTNSHSFRGRIGEVFNRWPNKGTLQFLYIEFNGHVREIVRKLAQRLQGAGFNIDLRKIADAST